MILVIEEFTNLDELYADIKSAVANRSEVQQNDHLPLKVEIHKNFDILEQELLVKGAYEGIRVKEELMSNKWNVDGTQISFIDKTKK